MGLDWKSGYIPLEISSAMPVNGEFKVLDK